jgi:hypothetical protein
VVAVISLLELGLHRGSLFSLGGAATGLVLSLCYPRSMFWL